MSEWILRTRQADGRMIGRLTSASPREQERYYLRVLLKNLHDATSYRDLLLRTGPDLRPLLLSPDVAHHSTFRDAALGLGLLDDDSLAWQTLEEGVQVMAAPALRRLLVMLLEWLPVKDAKAMWEKHSLEISADFLYDPEKWQTSNSPLAIAVAKATALHELHRLCRERNVDPTLHLPFPELDTCLRPSSKALQ